MATLTITNNTSSPVLVKELYAFVPASGSLVTEDRTRAEVDGMFGLLESVAAGDLSYTLALSADELAAGADQAESKLYLGAPAAAAAASVHANYNADEADNAFPGAFTNPDVPRNVTVTFNAAWDGGDVTIEGTDQFGNAISEVIADAAGSTVAGAKIFATVTGASKELVGAAAAPASIGTGTILGLSQPLSSASGNLLFADGVGEAGTWDATNHSVDPTTAPDGSAEFIVII